MEESLKSARSVHLVLIGICSAIALFAASPRETNKYLNARSELEALRTVDLADFVRHQKSLIVTHASTVSWLQPQTLFPNGRIVTSLAPEDLFPLVSDDSAVRHLQNGGAIEEWFTFFDTAHPVIVYLPDDNDAAFKEFLRTIIGYAQDTNQPELQSLSFKSGVDGDSPSPMQAYAVCSGGDRRLGSVFDRSVPAVETVISKDAFRPWLAEAASARQLRDFSTLSGAWLDQLRKVRNEVGGMKIADAAQYLENRISSNTRKINVLGATIEERLALVGAPIAALLALLYLLLVVRHLTTLPLKMLDEARIFPWPLLFPGRLAGAIAFASAWLPLVVCSGCFGLPVPMPLSCQ